MVLYIPGNGLLRSILIVGSAEKTLNMDREFNSRVFMFVIFEHAR